MRLLLVFLLAACCFLPATVDGASRQAIAEITGLTGEAQRLSDGVDGMVSVARGGMIYPGDEIVVSENGKINLYYMTDGHMFTLYGPAEMRFEKSGEDSVGDDDIISLLRGRLSALIKSLGGVSSGWSLETPSAVVGVRGTRFQLVVSEDGSSMVAVEEGRVYLSGEDGGVELGAGQESEVDMGGGPRRARRYQHGAKELAVRWQLERRKRMVEQAGPRMAQIKRRLKSHEAELRRNQTVINALLSKQVPRQMKAYEDALRAGSKRRASTAAAALKRSLTAARANFLEIQRLKRQGRNAVKTAGYLVGADPALQEEREGVLRGLRNRAKMLGRLEAEAREKFLEIRKRIRARRRLIDAVDKREGR